MLVSRGACLGVDSSHATRGDVETKTMSFTGHASLHYLVAQPISRSERLDQSEGHPAIRSNRVLKADLSLKREKQSIGDPLHGRFEAGTRNEVPELL
jgi:hypothetical protein